MLNILITTLIYFAVTNLSTMASLTPLLSNLSTLTSLTFLLWRHLSKTLLDIMREHPALKGTKGLLHRRKKINEGKKFITLDTDATF